jgi:hypothetical protein
MKTTNTILRLALASVLFAGAAVFTACSGDDSSNTNPAPTVHDSGVTTTPSDSSTTQPGTDSSTNPGTDSSTNPGTDSGQQGIDAALPDAGSCKSDSGLCNSCFTPAQDPVNGCSSAVGNCHAFDNTRVPANAP